MIYDVVLALMKEKDESKLEDFMAIMWTVWKVRNKSMFGNKAFSPHILLNIIDDFVAGFREAQKKLHHVAASAIWMEGAPFGGSGKSILMEEARGLENVIKY